MAAKDAALPKPKSLALCGRSYCALPNLFLSPTSTNFPRISQLTTTTTSTAVAGGETPLRRHSLLDRPHKLVRPVPLQGCRSTSALGNCRLFTTEAVLTEFLNALADKGHLVRAAAVEMVGVIMKNSQVTVIPQSQRTFSRSLAFYEARPDKGYSLTDCGSMLLMRERRLSEALTTDRHFEQEGFVALLRTR